MASRLLALLDSATLADLPALERETEIAANRYDLLAALCQQIRDRHAGTNGVLEPPPVPQLPPPAPPPTPPSVRDQVKEAHQRRKVSPRPEPVTDSTIKINNGAKCQEYRRKAKELLEARHDESFRPIQLANAIGCPHDSITAVLKHPWFLIGVNGEVNLTLAAKADVGTADEGGE